MKKLNSTKAIQQLKQPLYAALVSDKEGSTKLDWFAPVRFAEINHKAKQA